METPRQPAASHGNSGTAGQEGPDNLQYCLDSIAHFTRLPETWSGLDPISIVERVLDALVDRLCLDFAVFRFHGTAHVFVRIAAGFPSTGSADEVKTAIENWLANGEDRVSRGTQVEGKPVQIVRRSMGDLASLGVFVLGSGRPGFPQAADLLTLDAAASIAGLACREVRELSDRRLPSDLRAEGPGGEALSESEWRLDLIINTIPAMAWSATPDGMIDFVNQYFLDYIGGGFEGVGGLNFYQIFHPDDLPVLLAAWQEIMATKKTREIDGRLRRGDGSYSWCTLRQKPLLDADGNVLKWYGVVLDIEDRKRAEMAVIASEAALSASERNLSLILNSLPVLVWSARPDGTADFVNQMWVDYAGRPAEDILGWGFLDTYHPDDIPGMLEIWKRDLETGNETLITGRILGADGTYRRFLFKGSKLTDANGVIRWFGANIDVEDLQHAEDALRSSEAALQESERRLQQIISSIPGLAWASDETGATTYWSQQYLDYAGLEIEDVLGFGFLDHIHPDDLANVQEVWGATLASASPGEAEARLRRADGQYRWFLIRASPFFDSAGKLTQWFGVNVDIENRKRAEEELRQSQGDLAHVTRMMTMDELAVSIAHEVNQPLMAIVTNASACLRWLDGAQLDLPLARRTIERIVHDGHRAGDIITSIRALARKSPPKMERVSLDQVVRTVMDLLKGELRRRSIAAVTDLPEDGGIVLGDITQLQQVVLNLAMNAIDAMADAEPGDRILQVRLVTGGGRASVLVSDLGGGVQPGQAEQMFEPFFTTKSEGIGMGLSICRSIAEAHGGEILARANTPRGSVFTFSLPAAGEERFNAHH